MRPCAGGLAVRLDLSLRRRGNPRLRKHLGHDARCTLGHLAALRRSARDGGLGKVAHRRTVEPATASGAGSRRLGRRDRSTSGAEHAIKGYCLHRRLR